jgi:hypothetical protein
VVDEKYSRQRYRDKRGVWNYSDTQGKGRVMKMVILSMMLFLLVGCAVLSTNLKNPQTNEIVKCEHWGWGWLGTPMALIMHQDCIDKMKKSGYIPVKEKEEE